MQIYLDGRYMEEIKQKLTGTIDRNKVILESLHDQTQDMKRYLKKPDCIIYINCTNLTIVIDSVINRLEFKQCSGIKLQIKGLISGVLIEKCKEINISSSRIPSVTVSRSDNINIENRTKRTVYTDIDRSFHISITKYRKN